MYKQKHNLIQHEPRHLRLTLTFNGGRNIRSLLVLSTSIKLTHITSETDIYALVIDHLSKKIAITLLIHTLLSEHYIVISITVAHAIA